LSTAGLYTGLDHLGGGQHQQIAVTLALAGEDAYLMTVHDQTLTQAAPDETGSAQYGDA
jgi:ABC-type polar amino acid transport system ATPase subunit